ncbi:MAG: methyltransferase domain-containing protein [Endomicrobiales bacterium]|nr:methyltransferase domain-containing protein [Endomicrobiales bacterium]
MVSPPITYESYWDLRLDDGIPKRYGIFASYLQDGSSVADLGCGDGRLLKYLSGAKKLLVYDGYDISENAVQKAEKKGIHCQTADLTKPDFCLSRNYDFIILSEVIEHITLPENILSSIKNRFNKAVLLSFPNTGYLPYRLRLFLLGRFPVQWNWHPSEHVRFWTLRDFRDWAKNIGYEIVSIEVADGIPILSELMPGLFASSIVAVLKNSKEQP